MKKILVFVAYYLPCYKSGGTVRTIANMVGHMSDDFDFKIVASDRDLFETESYANITQIEQVASPKHLQKRFS